MVGFMVLYGLKPLAMAMVMVSTEPPFYGFDHKNGLLACASS
jgi:hypothetical protein